MNVETGSSRLYLIQLHETKKENGYAVVLFFCGDYRTRTGHLQIANLTLYQMS